MIQSLDQGESTSPNFYVCRACRQTQSGPRVARLCGRLVCPACRDRYIRESDAAQADVNHRWMSVLLGDSKP